VLENTEPKETIVVQQKQEHLENIEKDKVSELENKATGVVILEEEEEEEGEEEEEAIISIMQEEEQEFEPQIMEVEVEETQTIPQPSSYKEETTSMSTTKSPKIESSITNPPIIKEEKIRELTSIV